MKQEKIKGVENQMKQEKIKCFWCNKFFFDLIKHIKNTHKNLTPCLDCIHFIRKERTLCLICKHRKDFLLIKCFGRN